MKTEKAFWEHFDAPGNTQIGSLPEKNSRCIREKYAAGNIHRRKGSSFYTGG
jgi:hypothetical protein